MDTEAEVEISPTIAKSSPHRLPADGQEQHSLCGETDARRKLVSHSYMSMAARPSSPVTDVDCKDTNEADNSDSPVPPGTPPYLKWARNLPSLLEDPDGIELFMQYLKEEDQDTSCLHFLLACQGIRQQKEGKVLNLIKVIHRKFIRGLSSKLGIEPATKDEIDYKITNAIGLDETLFDAARKEVELTVMKTTYPNFLRSDVYVQHVQMMQDAALCRTPDRVSIPDSDCAVGSLDEVQFRQNDPPSPGEVNNKKNSSVSGSQERVDLLPTVFEDSELHCAPGNKLVQVTLTRMSKRKLTLSRQKPEDQAGHYLKPTTPGYNTSYKYAPYLPPSAQDSASSDAQTDDAISIADSVENYSLSYKSREKTAVSKMTRYQHGLKATASLNVDHLSQNIIPRTQLGPPQGWGHAMPPHKFAELLTAKLRKVQQDREMREMLQMAFNNLNSASRNSNNDGSSSNKSNTLKLFNPSTEPEDESQSILDEHVSRAIPSSHQTPRQSPGCLTPPVPQRQEGSSSSSSMLPLPTNPQRLPQAIISSSQLNKMPSSPSGSNFKSGRDSPHFVYHDGNRLRRDRDAYSIDSGLLQDDLASDLESQCPSQYAPSREQDCRRRGSYPLNEQNMSMLGRHDSGISLSETSCGTSRREKIPSWPDMHKASVSDSERDLQVYRKRHPHYGTPSKLVGACGSTWTGSITSSSSQWYNQQSSVCPVTSLDAVSSYSPQIVCGSVQTGHGYAWDQGMSGLDIPSGEKQGKQKSVLYGREKFGYDGARCKTISKSYEIPEDGALHRKSNRKSCPSSLACVTKPSSNEYTTVAYCIGRQTVPYLSKIPGKCINLRQFKSLVSKKGNFRYFFKTEKEDIGVVYEEKSEDMEVLPIFEGKIFSIVEPIE